MRVGEITYDKESQTYTVAFAQGWPVGENEAALIFKALIDAIVELDVNPQVMMMQLMQVLQNTE